MEPYVLPAKALAAAAALAVTGEADDSVDLVLIGEPWGADGTGAEGPATAVPGVTLGLAASDVSTLIGGIGCGIFPITTGLGEGWDTDGAADTGAVAVIEDAAEVSTVGITVTGVDRNGVTTIGPVEEKVIGVTITGCVMTGPLVDTDSGGVLVPGVLEPLTLPLFAAITAPVTTAPLIMPPTPVPGKTVGDVLDCCTCRNCCCCCISCCCTCCICACCCCSSCCCCCCTGCCCCCCCCWICCVCGITACTTCCCCCCCCAGTCNWLWYIWLVGNANAPPLEEIAFKISWFVICCKAKNSSMDFVAK